MSTTDETESTIAEIAAPPPPQDYGQPGHVMHAGEMAGVGSLAVTVIVGVLVGLERFGFFTRSKIDSVPQAPVAATAPVIPAAPPVPSVPSSEALEAIRTRLTGVETRLGTMEQTMVALDNRDRNDAAVLARLEGRIESWDDRLGRIEAALTGGKR